MEIRHLGGSGLEVSEPAPGTMQSGWTTDEANAWQDH
jgi:aryl-alcohol dehydrogenase-like predicted oxidoreductase